MKLFGRKKKEEEIDDVPATRGVSRKASAEVLEKPKRTRRKKEEPPKPWGKGERILVFGVLFATVGIAGFLALSARSWKLPGLPRLALPTGVLQETYVFEGKVPTRDTSKVIADFDELTKNTSGVYGFYVINLNSDESYGVNIDERFQAASLIKLPVMAAMYKEAERENIELEDIYTLRNADKVGGAGTLFYQEEGSEYSYRELVSLMGQQSDNTAFRASVNLLGADLVEQYINEFGMENTSYDENETTPRDIGNFFKKLWERKFVSRASRDEILKSLTKTVYETLIPAGITDVRVAHKYGAEVHVLNDAGIVFADDPYVLVIMSKGILEQEAREVIPQLATLIHQFETNEE